MFETKKDDVVNIKKLVVIEKLSSSLFVSKAWFPSPFVILDVNGIPFWVAWSKSTKDSFFNFIALPVKFEGEASTLKVNAANIFTVLRSFFRSFVWYFSILNRNVIVVLQSSLAQVISITVTFYSLFFGIIFVDSLRGK